MPSLVVTLGTLYVIRGIDAAWAGGNQVGAFSLPDSFNKIGFETFLGVPYLGWILHRARWRSRRTAMRSFRTGRDFYAIGSNPEAARLAGIPVGSRVFLAFVLCGGDRRGRRRALALEVRLGRRDRRARATSSR